MEKIKNTNMLENLIKSEKIRQNRKFNYQIWFNFSLEGEVRLLKSKYTAFLACLVRLHCYQNMATLLWSPNIDEVHSRFAEVVFKNILLTSLSWSYIFIRFSVFFINKPLNNFSRKLDFSDLYLQRAVFQQWMHVQSSS